MDRSSQPRVGAAASFARSVGPAALVVVALLGAACGDPGAASTTEDARRRRDGGAALDASDARADAPASAGDALGTDDAAPPPAPGPGPAVCATSWLANSFGDSHRWVQDNIADIFVAADGAVYTDSEWDEASGEAMVYRDGAPSAVAGHTHGWGSYGGRAVTANGAYLYLGARMDSEGGHLVDANTWPPGGTYWYGVSRRAIADVTAGAPFAGGKGGSGDTLAGAFLVVNAVPEGTLAHVAGLAADASRLYVSNPFRGEIRVYDATSMAQLATWSVPRTGRLALGSGGTLWAIQTADGSNPARVIHVGGDGRVLADAVTDVGEPTDVALDTAGRLLVTDAGPHQNVRVYDVSAPAPRLVATLGDEGGIYSGRRGEVADHKLASPIGVGADGAGNVYVASALVGTDLRAFGPDGAMRWRALGLVFDETAVADPATDGADVYTQGEHYAMDYNRPTGQEWTYRGTTLDRLRFPTDPRLIARNAANISPIAVRALRGQRYLFAGMGQDLIVFRFDGEILVPCVWFSSAGWVFENTATLRHPDGRWIWRDANGDGNLQTEEFVDADGGYDFGVWGWDVDRDGDLWQADESRGLRRFPLMGVDAAGVPQYSRGSVVEQGTPTPFTRLERVRYLAETDTLYLTGYTADNPKTGTEWGSVGREIARYDGWRAGNRAARYRITLPYPDPNSYGHIKSWAVAGDRVFAGLLSSRGPAQSSDAHNLYVYDATSGAALGEVLPGPEVGGAIGWLDITDSLTAMRRSNGEYVVFMEEVYWEKVIMYRLPETAAPSCTLSPTPRM